MLKSLFYSELFDMRERYMKVLEYCLIKFFSFLAFFLSSFRPMSLCFYHHGE